jgi:hypothetical protein
MSFEPQARLKRPTRVVTLDVLPVKLEDGNELIEHFELEARMRPHKLLRAEKADHRTRLPKIPGPPVEIRQQLPEGREKRLNATLQP